MITKKFYFPLLCRLADEDCWEGIEVSNSYISEIESEIAEDLEKYQDFGSEKMHEFFDANEDVSNKLLSTVWSFEKIDEEYYGCVTVQLSEEIDTQGVSDLKDWISGQNSDGLGEGFEQRDFDVEDGSLSISFWKGTDDYFIYDDEEMKRYLHPSPIKHITTDDSRKIGGKPDCALIGQDGNIFNLMGIASKTLRKHGMADEAQEMCTRIRASDDYYKALAIISEYVNITSTDGIGETTDFEQTM